MKNDIESIVMDLSIFKPVATIQRRINHNVSIITEKYNRDTY